MRPMLKATLLPLALASASCVNLAPDYVRPDLPVPSELPGGASGTSMDELIAWDQVVVSNDLKEIIRLALSENRDLKAAAANVEIARAQYGLTQSAFLPTVTASGSAVEGGLFDNNGPNTSTFRDSAVAQLGVSAYELDFFGRVRNLSDAALQTYLSTAEGEKAARIAIVSSVAEIYLSLSTDLELLALAEDTVDAQSDSLALTQELFNAGVATELDTRRASASVETARAQAAQFEAQVRQDRNALRIVVGATLPQSLTSSASLTPSPVNLEIPVGINSDILLNRPDVIAAERTLLAAHANIGAARANLFPSISLTGRAGYSSSDLEDFFNSDVAGWTFGPSISLPIFDNGARQRQVEISEARQQLALAQYESAIQSAFQETADALAVAETIDTRLAALSQLSEDAEVTLNLSMERFRIGVDDYLSVLDAQRQDYSAQQQLILARRDRALNAIALYRALGGVPETTR